MLQNEGLDNHCRAINDILPKCVEHGLPALGLYLDKRFIQTQQLKELKRGLLNYKHGMEYVVTYSEIWCDVTTLIKKSFIESPLAIDTEVKFELLDIPEFHNY